MSSEEMKQVLKARVENDFTYHAPLPGQPERYTQLREKAKELALLIVDLTPSSREQSVALTLLEQASMMANAAIARNEKPQTTDPNTLYPDVLG
jgi:hypothetical protein